MQPTSQLNLKTISASGKPPASRLNDAGEVLELAKKLISADEKRSAVRARVKGLVDGNPPYNPAELRKLGQSYRTNVNFRESEGFLALGLSAFYDIFSEAPTYATVRVNYGTASDSEVYSRIITEEFDRLQKKDDDFDYLIQLSQHEMVLYGIGPLMFEDETNWKCKAVKCCDILVPEGTKSNVNEWTVCVVRSRYQAHELYGFIQNEKAAKATGWDVKAARKAIMEAAPENYGSNRMDWEWHQQQLRNNDISYSSRSDVVLASHVFYREFPSEKHPRGSISHCIVDERGTGGESFLFRKVSRYENWQQAIHCLFYDKGDGTFHSVKGMGIKMCGAMEIKNRLRCALVDAAFARAQILLQPTTPDALNKTNIVQMGPMAILPAGYNVVQQNIAGALDAPMSISTDLEGLLQANLSQYRQRLEKSEGNPRTATEVDAIVAQQSSLGKTQLNRYYEQLDALFAERYRRASSKKLSSNMSGGKEADEFMKRCHKRGVPHAAMESVDYVRATRTVGRGSEYDRRRTMNELIAMVSMLPETGRHNVIEDAIASMVGYQNVERYFPSEKTDSTLQEQNQESAIENALFKIGAMIPVSDMDHHTAHAQAHLAFGVQAAQAIEQGGDITEIAATLQILIPHLGEHIAKIQTDPSRRGDGQVLEQQAKQLAQVAMQIIKEVAKQGEQMAQQQQQQQQQGPDIETQEMLRDQERKDSAHQFELKRKEEIARQELMIRDAKAAMEMRRI